MDARPHRLRDERRPRRGWVVAVIVCLVASVTGTGPVVATEPAPTAPLMPETAELDITAAIEVSDQPSAGEVPDLGSLSDFAWDIAESMPAEHWNVEALAESLLYDPMAAFGFVRDHIRYEPYRGVLRGPEGTLAARAGNSLDRSLLLAALLDLMLVDYRFASARLDDPALESVMAVARSGAPVPIDAEPPGARLAVGTMAARARRDFARLAQTLGPRFPGTVGTDEASASDAARDHVWVRIRFGAQWLDLDTTLPGAEPGDVLAAATSESIEPPGSLRHEIVLRVVVESLRGDILTEDVVLEQRLDAVDASGRRIFLYFQPDLSGMGGAILDVLTGDEQWVPVILVDDAGVAGRPFSAGGKATDLFGDPTEVPEVVSLRLLATTVSPGGPDEGATHVLFDRRPPGASQGTPGSPVRKDELEPLARNDGAPLALAGIYHVMISTGGASPRTFAYQQSQVADMVASALLDEETAAEYSFADRLWPLALADQSLVIISEQVMVPAAGGADAHGYVARPRVYMSSIAPDPSDVSLVTLTTDLMIDGVRILPRTPGTPTAPRQVWYGALQSALEVELGLRRAAAVGESPAGDVTAASFATDKPLGVLAGDGREEMAAGVHPALVADLAAGRLVVAPVAAASIESWWSVEPATGVTRAMISPGLRGYRDAPDPGGRQEGRILDTSKAKYNYGGPRMPKRGGIGPRPNLPGPYRPVGPAPVGCGPNEYTIIVACVSLPAAIVFWGFGVVLSIIIVWYANSLYQAWLCTPPATFCAND